MRGKITQTISGRDFFFIDGNYFCHLSKVDFEPRIGDEVEYERTKNKNGRPEATNVRRIGTVASTTRAAVTTALIPFDQYPNELDKGYFEEGYIRKEFLIEYPKALADLFGRNPAVNTSAQIRNYFEFCRQIEGIFKMKKDFNYVKSKLPKLMFYVNNAYNKAKPLVSKEFKIFIEKNVELAMQNEKYFLEGFMPHFEAIIGYSKKQ